MERWGNGTLGAGRARVDRGLGLLERHGELHVVGGQALIDEIGGAVVGDLEGWVLRGHRATADEEGARGFEESHGSQRFKIQESRFKSQDSKGKIQKARFKRPVAGGLPATGDGQLWLLIMSTMTAKASLWRTWMSIS